MYRWMHRLFTGSGNLHGAYTECHISVVWWRKVKVEITSNRGMSNSSG